jgi:hypothetical protein
LYVLLPVFRSGKISTLAWPATSEPGSLVAATDGSTAASYWMGPSIFRSVRRSRTSSVARRTLSTSAPEPDVPVEYDSIAIRGSTPNCSAVAAAWTAMSASCRASGSGFTAQSPYTRTLSARHMKKTDDTMPASGFVLMISKAGRIVAAVECTEPDTMPSARPPCTISVPK